MCTVTFIPYKESYFITSNRDENPARRSTGLQSIHSTGKNAIHYPLDNESSGSWITLANSGKAVCLLNGAFEPFVPKPSYRVSRGQVVIDASIEDDFQLFRDQYNLEDIAPFTLLVFENNSFVELIWDGIDKHFNKLSTEQPQIWSSVTLYPESIREWRKSLFQKWINSQPQFDRELIIRFHHLANEVPENDLIMNRNEKVKTLSVTSIEINPASASIMHMDVEDETREEILVPYQ